jgi:hypothetical protein
MKKGHNFFKAITNQFLWIWHAFFGLLGGNNDINVVDQSPMVANMINGINNDLKFKVNGNVYP